MAAATAANTLRTQHPATRDRSPLCKRGAAPVPVFHRAPGTIRSGMSGRTPAFRARLSRDGHSVPGGGSGTVVAPRAADLMRRPFAHLGCAAALAAVALAAKPGVTSAFSDQSAVIDQSATPFKSRTSLVALTVTVQDPSARYITDLEPADFAVYEDGVRQDVRFFQSESLPVDLIVLLDTSRSMAGKVESVRDAAQAFLGTLRPGDRGAVVAFNERLQLVQPLTDDREALMRALQSARASGFTALRNALYVRSSNSGRP